MSVKRTKDGRIIVNDSLEIDHGVIYMGVGPYICLSDLDDEESVRISTKQEAEQVIKACQGFLDSLDTWDFVYKDKPDDSN